MKSKKLLKLLFIISLSGLTFSTIVVLVMHLISTDLNPISTYISDYAVGAYGELAAFSFSVYGISGIAFFLWIRKVLSRKIKSKTELRLILLFGLAITLLGVFNTDPKMEKLSTNGTIHMLSALVALLSFSIGSIWISRDLRRSVLKSLSWISLILLITILFGSSVDLSSSYNLFLPDVIKPFSNIVGLTERLYFLTVTAWILLVGYYLKKIKL